MLSSIIFISYGINSTEYYTHLIFYLQLVTMSLDFTSPESTAISRIYEQYDGLAANDSNDLSDAGTTVSDESAQTSETSATNESIGAVTSAVQDPYKGMKTNLISPHPVGGVVDTITTLTDTDQALEDDMSERGFIQPNSTIIDVMGCSLNEHINEAAEKNSFRPTEMIQTRTDSVLSLDLPSLSGKVCGIPVSRYRHLTNLRLTCSHQ